MSSPNAWINWNNWMRHVSSWANEEESIDMTSTKRFQKGDLVLLYTLKNHKRKLKKQGLGPFVVNELSNAGAVRLETIDGEPMGDYINGSRLKRYEEPLTEQLLQCLHATTSSLTCTTSSTSTSV